MVFFFFSNYFIHVKNLGMDGKKMKLRILSLVSKKQKEFYPLIPNRCKHTLKFSYTIFDESYLSLYGTIS